MIKANITKILLTSVEYNFTKPNKNDIKISFSDEIQIRSLNENGFLLNVMRVLDFGEKTGSFIKIVFEVEFESSENYDKESISEEIKNGISKLSPVYSRMSLLISEICNLSPFGVIITPPMYNNDEIIIK